MRVAHEVELKSFLIEAQRVLGCHALWSQAGWHIFAYALAFIWMWNFLTVREIGQTDAFDESPGGFAVFVLIMFPLFAGVHT